MEDITKEYKKRLGKKMGTMSLPKGKETFGIKKFENGFILSKRKNKIVLDRFNLWALRDEIDRFEKRLKIYEKLK